MLTFAPSAGQYLCYNWRWRVADSGAHTPDNMANVAVIDGGKRRPHCDSPCSITYSHTHTHTHAHTHTHTHSPAHILLTPFRHTVIPPPMCGHRLSLPSPVLQVCFAPAPQCNDFLVLLASGEVAVFCYGGTRGSGEGEKTSSFRQTTHPPQLVGITR